MGKAKRRPRLACCCGLQGTACIAASSNSSKKENENLGEFKASKQLGVEWFQTGDGFIWKSSNLDETETKVHLAWALAQEKISSGDYEVVVLDEFTYALSYGWLDVNTVVAWLREFKPEMLHLVITGRDAPPELVEFADLVTEMNKVKHPFDRGIYSQRGVEF